MYKIYLGFLATMASFFGAHSAEVNSDVPCNFPLSLNLKDDNHIYWLVFNSVVLKELIPTTEDQHHCIDDKLSQVKSELGYLDGKVFIYEESDPKAGKGDTEIRSGWIPLGSLRSGTHFSVGGASLVSQSDDDLPIHYTRHP